MPTYDYCCNSCEKRFEIFHAMSEKPDVKCPECGKDAEKQMGGGAGIIVKSAPEPGAQCRTEPSGGCTHACQEFHGCGH